MPWYGPAASHGKTKLGLNSAAAASAHSVTVSHNGCHCDTQAQPLRTLLERIAAFVMEHSSLLIMLLGCAPRACTNSRFEGNAATGGKVDSANVNSEYNIMLYKPMIHVFTPAGHHARRRRWRPAPDTQRREAFSLHLREQDGCASGQRWRSVLRRRHAQHLGHKIRRERRGHTRRRGVRGGQRSYHGHGLNRLAQHGGLS